MRFALGKPDPMGRVNVVKTPKVPCKCKLQSSVEMGLGRMFACDYYRHVEDERTMFRESGLVIHFPCNLERLGGFFCTKITQILICCPG